MSDNSNVDDKSLSLAKELVVALEANESDKANHLISAIAEHNDAGIFKEVGKITRGLHDKLVSFESDLGVSDIDESEIHDAKLRLSYVIEKTSEAADQTLTIIESFMPSIDRQGKESESLINEWQKFTGKELSADEFRCLAKRVTDYLNESNALNADYKAGLNEIIVAQGFQDITGQIIKKVINLVQEVEDSLVRVIKCTGGEKSTRKITSSIDELEGPVVPSLKTNEFVSNQDEVDDLLSSLGF